MGTLVCHRDPYICLHIHLILDWLSLLFEETGHANRRSRVQFGSAGFG
ncbi:hypothetical protein Hdeb2414_s0170g00821941 [Helianthus debilis subsp. tardiflorus]